MREETKYLNKLLKSLAGLQSRCPIFIKYEISKNKDYVFISTNYTESQYKYEIDYNKDIKDLITTIHHDLFVNDYPKLIKGKKTFVIDKLILKTNKFVIKDLNSDKELVCTLKFPVIVFIKLYGSENISPKERYKHLKEYIDSIDYGTLKL